MTEPQKPFACTFPDCGMSFTNEDHLHVHTKKHDMQLQFGPEQKAAFVADQTPTPTRFIRNCEEVGLFQDLQNVTVNPFDEGFKRAMETKQGILSLETLSSADDVLHTPQMVFPLMEGDSALFSATNNQRNITISRSSSDESGTIKEYETTTISKLTNEVTTISRIVGNRDLVDKASTEDVSIVTNTDIVHNKDNIETVSYKNNVIKIHSNVEIRKDSVNIENKAPVLIFTDTVTKDAVKDVLLADTNKLQVPEKLPPIMSQKSLDFVVDSLTSELDEDDRDKPIIKSNVTIKTDDVKVTEAKIPKTPKVVKRYIRRNIQPVRVTASRNELNEKTAKKIRIEPKSHNEEYEVIIKLPNGKHVIMKAVDEATPDPKEILKRNLANKIIRQQSQTNPVTLHHNVLHIPGGGTLIPVTFLNDTGNVTSIPVTNLSNVTIPVTQLNHKVPISANPTNIKNLANEPNLIKVVKFTNKIIPVTNSNISKSFPKVKVSRAFQLDDNGKRKDINKKVPPKTNNNIANKIEREENARISEEPIVINEEPVIIHEDLKNNMEDDIEIEIDSPDAAKRTKIELQSRCAASKRYRSRVRETLKKQSDEIKQLRESNQSLAAERALLKLLIVEHMKRCPNSEDFQISCHAKTLQNINMNGF